MNIQPKEALDYKKFSMDILDGLSSPKKHLSSKYFYDKKGSLLFNRITRHPDYYLTSCEIEILKNNKEKIANLFGNIPFNIIELGPGEGLKASILIDCFIEKKLDFFYYMIDISKEYIEEISQKFHKIPEKIKTIHADFFSGLKTLQSNDARKKIVLFLGSSIGNFDPEEACKFFEEIRDHLNSGDYFLIGFDLVKSQTILHKAYDDRAGITRAFNLNLLDRINKELYADFDTENFSHLAKYNDDINAMESYLVSLKDQAVHLKKPGKIISFQKDETIHMEYSYKYQLEQIEHFAKNSGFKIVDNFIDKKQYFVNSLWEKI